MKQLLNMFIIVVVVVDVVVVERMGEGNYPPFMEPSSP